MVLSVLNPRTLALEMESQDRSLSQAALEQRVAAGTFGFDLVIQHLAQVEPSAWLSDQARSLAEVEL